MSADDSEATDTPFEANQNYSDSSSIKGSLEGIHNRRIYLFLIIIAVIYFIEHVFAITVFLRCRKLAKQVRFWLLNQLFTNCTAGVCVFIHFIIINILMTLVPENIPAFFPDFVCPALIVCYRSCIYSTFIITSAVSLDRFCSLRYALYYQSWVTFKRLSVYVMVIYTMGFFLSIPGILYDELSTTCKFIHYTIPQRWIAVAIAFTVTILNVVVNTIVGITTIKKKRSYQSMSSGNEYGKFLKITFKSVALASLSFLTLLPASVLQVWSLLFHELSNEYPEQTASLLYVFFFVIPVIFVLSFNETRYILVETLCCCLSRTRKRLEHEYKQHYSSFVINVDLSVRNVSNN